MTNEERFKKYIQENYKNCKNRTTDLCDIREKMDGTLKCIYYEREKKQEGYKDKIKINVTAKRNKPIMEGIDK